MMLQDRLIVQSTPLLLVFPYSYNLRQNEDLDF